LLLVLGTLAVYVPAAHHGFTLYDDSDYVTDNPMVENGLTWAGVKWAFAWHAANWHPLTWLSHMADCQLAGLNPSVPHCENILFHAANTVLLFALLLRLTSFSSSAPARSAGVIWSSAFAAALFAWHPLHVESVAWISERKDVLSTFFALLALLAYTRFVEESKPHPPSPSSDATGIPKSRIFYGLALLAFALGLMAKPMLVTLPFVMLLLDYWPLQRTNVPGSKFRVQSLLLEKIPFFALSAASCVITFLAQHHGGAVATLKSVPVYFRLCNMPVAYVDYLLKTICPVHLAVFYPINPLPLLEVAAATAAMAVISWLTWRVRRVRPYCLIGWLWFLGTLVPVIGLVQVGGAAMADRYTYFPGIGIFLAAALGLRDGAARFRISDRIVGTIIGLVLAACLALTHRQLDFWQDDITLFRHAIAVTKDNETAHLNLGFALQKTGLKTEAMAEYRTAIKLNPGRADAHNDLANILDDTGHPDEAVAEYQEALRLNPDHVASHSNYGTLLVELGRFDEAMKEYAAAARLDPSDWHPPYLTGKALLKQGRDLEAVLFFRQAVQRDPNNPRVLTYLAQVLASDENPQVRDGNTALAMAAKANDLTGGIQPVMLDAMAMAYAEIGQFTNAQQTAAYALKLAAAYDMTNDAPLIQQHLQLYQDRQPFRQSFLFTNAPANKPMEN
jgi:tetratricopeptide (TPR) repeat protein